MYRIQQLLSENNVKLGNVAKEKRENIKVTNQMYLATFNIKKSYRN